MRVVIISRQRAKICVEASFSLLPHATVAIGEEEVDDYVKAGIPREQVLVHPTDVIGISKKRNWVLRNVDDECVVMFDDDCIGVACLVGERPRRLKDEGSIMRVLKNSEECARAIGTGYFGYNTVGMDVRKFKPSEPFRFIGFSAALHGIIGREVWFDEQFMVFEAVDWALQCIRRWRVIWLDYRFAFLSYVKMGYVYGGVQSFKTASRDRLERNMIKQKWGKYYSMRRWRSGEAISHLSVERKQRDILVGGGLKAT